MANPQLETVYQSLVKNECSYEEFLFLLDELVADEEEKKEILFRLFDQTWESLNVFPGQFALPVLQLPSSPVVQRKSGSVKRLNIWSWAAGAAAILLLCLGVYWMASRNDQPPVASSKKRHSPIEIDVEPGKSGAILTLNDGSQIVLDTAGNGSLATQGKMVIVNKNGALSYEGKSDEVLYNTITTPAGRQYTLTLADGSRVWLNAASSLHFPTAFNNNRRTVEVTGEAYFEVAHDKTKPFIVKAGSLEVEVLGTHFNINAYTDEHNSKTTLVEGKVKVVNGESTGILNPGQQARLTAGSGIRIVDDVDVDEVLAWKNGSFLFNSAGIESVMRQISRWYDVEVVYESKLHETISGGFSRSANLSQILKILEATGKVEFRANGRQIIVSAH